MFGDVVFVELFEIDVEIDVGDSFLLVELVKVVFDIYVLVTGVVIEVNEDL